MKRWNQNFSDLLAPYYHRLKQIIEDGPDEKNEQQVEFYKAVKTNTAKRPLQAAWLSLHELPEPSRTSIIQSFSEGTAQQKLTKSKMAFEKLLSENYNHEQIDYYKEMLDQGISPPSGKIHEPLGSREDHLKETSKNKYNSQ